MNNCEVTFISQEKLGVFFANVESALRKETKKKRAAHMNWVADTLRRLGLIDASGGFGVVAITIGADRSGNYGLFVIQERIQKE